MDWQLITSPPSRLYTPGAVMLPRADRTLWLVDTSDGFLASYDPATDVWTDQPDFTPVSVDFTGIVAVGVSAADDIIFFLREDSTHISATRYNADGSGTQLGALFNISAYGFDSYNARAVNVAGTLYFNWPGPVSPHSNFVLFNTTTHSWSTAGDYDNHYMTTQLGVAAGASVIYALGGFGYPNGSDNPGFSGPNPGGQWIQQANRSLRRYAVGPGWTTPLMFDDGLLGPGVEVKAGLIYVIAGWHTPPGGVTSGPAADVYVIDPSGWTITTETDFPESQSNLASAVTADDVIFAGGGYLPDGYSYGDPTGHFYRTPPGVLAAVTSETLDTNSAMIARVTTDAQLLVTPAGMIEE